MNEKYTHLISFGKKLLSKASLMEGMPYISQSAKELIGAERCSIFIYDLKRNELWATLSDGVDRIVIPSDMGIVGQAIKLEAPIVENDAYSNPNFLSDIDIKTGYFTKNILTAPIFNSHKEVVGAIQLLNKAGGFDKKDVEFISFFSHYISGFIELEIKLHRQH